MSFDDQDSYFMMKALHLAEKGRGTTSPNPMVGAVLVSNGQVIGTGYHKKAGGPHAEIVALRKSRSRAKHSTLYVTLEPCCHKDKRTPPCVPAVIEAGVRRVVVAMRDPNPKVKGRGIKKLQEAGIQTDVGCCRAEAERLNRAYVHRIKTGRPFVILKTAITLDGKIGRAKGESKWITGLKAREHVHRVRSQVDAILVGIKTVLADDPQLTVRLPVTKTDPRIRRSPLRVVLDSQLRIPLSSRVLQNVHRHPTLIATTQRANKEKINTLRAKGVRVMVFPQKRTGVPLLGCLRYLSSVGIATLLVEGGSEINASVIQGGFGNQLMLYIAPTVMGGRGAKGWIERISPEHSHGTISVSDCKLTPLGEDLLVTGWIIDPAG